VALEQARVRGHCALIPYLTLGHPSLEASLALLAGLEELGVEAVEIGVPFSDPVADGPTIQRTIEGALARGVTLRRILEALRPSDGARILFSYLNPLLAHGMESLPAALAGVGVGAVLITDLVPEEAGAWIGHARSGGIETCWLVASTSNDARLVQAAEASSGFVYCVATLGVTGSRRSLDESARATVARLRRHSEVPVAVGFGLSTAEDVLRVRSFADGAVVGSALMRALGDEVDPDAVRRRGVDWIGPLLEAARD
jgi:tryptophan synthase alpha chain